MKVLAYLLLTLFAAPPARQLNGLVLTTAGKPVAGASLWQRDQPTNTTTTNAEGQFILPRPDKPSFYLRVEVPGFIRQDRLVTDTTVVPLRIVLTPVLKPRRR